MSDTPAAAPPVGPNADPEFWKRKLLAFLHDPPDKCFDIAGHGENARSFLAGAGLADPQELAGLNPQARAADHFASAADRFVFPRGRCSTTYTGHAGSCFLHPLSSCPFEVPPAIDLAAQTGHLHGILQAAVGGIGTADPRVRFFLYWRRWLENSVTADKRHADVLAFLPADSRLPDHSIWNHMAVTSALAGCVQDGDVRPAMLLLQLGPVQDFIAQARSTRDLWSGSYLLSWLVAHAMKAVSDQVGPDAIVFPSLRGNGLFDALHRTDVYAATWDDGHGRTATTWQRLIEEKRAGQTAAEIRDQGDRAARWLLTPTLPNRFLALVPAARADQLARDAESAVRAELGRIGEAVWAWVATEARDGAKRPAVENWKARWDAQVAAFLQVTWAVQPWLGREACLAECERLPANDRQRTDAQGKAVVTPLRYLQTMLDLAEKWLPVQDRDPRFYADADARDPGRGKTRLNNPGALWPAHYALVDARLAARRNTRGFPAWSDPTRAVEGTPKDSLSGKEECIGDEAFWEHLAQAYPKVFTGGGHRYGAMNLVKRLWCRSDKVPYLRDRLGLTEREFAAALRFETVEDVARGNRHGGPYVAVLAMDGDEMGKWVSGEKTPEFLKQLSANAAGYLRPILEEHGVTGARRLLTPSYHLQLSEALANYSTWLAEPVVQAYGGQLVYAGGDDVLAMLPADRAITCAEALRAVFRGTPPDEQARLPLAIQQEGYIRESAGCPLTVPGPAADVSVGLAVGHCNAPLQMLVREAQRAEKRAKNTYRRGALAVSLYKRSGEIVEWGCKWDDGQTKVALQLMRRLAEWSAGDPPPLSGRFPYALAGLLAPYDLDGKASVPPDVLLQIIGREFDHVVAQQATGLEPADRDELRRLAGLWLTQTAERPQDFVKLFLVETFINRNRGED